MRHRPADRIHELEPGHETRRTASQTVGGHTYTVQQTELHIPYGSYDAKVDDVATVTGYRYGFRVRGLINLTHATAQRLLVDAVTA